MPRYSLRARAILPLASLIMLLAGTVWFAIDFAIVKHDVATTGTVIRNIPHGRYGYAPVIAYSVDGAAYTFTPLSSQAPAAYAPGDHVPLFYNPADPAQAKLNSFLSLWFGPAMLLLAGTIMALVAFFLNFKFDEAKKSK